MGSIPPLEPHLKEREVEWEQSELAKAMGQMCGMKGPHPFPYHLSPVPPPEPWIIRNKLTIWVVAATVGMIIGLFLPL